RGEPRSAGRAADVSEVHLRGLHRARALPAHAEIDIIRVSRAARRRPGATHVGGRVRAIEHIHRSGIQRVRAVYDNRWWQESLQDRVDLAASERRHVVDAVVRIRAGESKLQLLQGVIESQADSRTKQGVDRSARSEVTGSRTEELRVHIGITE